MVIAFDVEIGSPTEPSSGVAFDVLVMIDVVAKLVEVNVIDVEFEPEFRFASFLFKFSKEVDPADEDDDEDDDDDDDDEEEGDAEGDDPPTDDSADNEAKCLLPDAFNACDDRCGGCCE